MTFRRKFSLIISILMLVQLVFVPVLAETEPSDTSVLNGCRGIDSQMPLLGNSEVTENAQSIVLFEANSDTLMYTWNPDQQMYPAGLVKILTALIAIENGTFTEIVTVKESVLDTVSQDARTSKLQIDEILTVEQLIHCVLVEGSNDAAAVLADHIAGSQTAFVQMMNAYAADLGCTNTVFTNVHGLHDEAQLTTARDIARILDVAIENEQFKTIFGTTHYKLEKTNKSIERTLESSNHMMHKGMYEIYFDSRITGGRTGVNNVGQRCIATTSNQGDLDMICVIMGSASDINDRGIVEKIGGFYETKDLLDLAFSGYKIAEIIFEDQAVKQYSVRNGSADVVAAPAISIRSVVPQNATSETFTYRYIDVEGAFTAPIKRGAHLSRVEIWHGNVCIGQADLYALNDVDVNYQQIIDKNKKGLPVWAIILIVVLALVIVGFAVLYGLRMYNMRRISGRKRRKRGSQRQ